jgi:hypothetical protein
VHIRTSCKDQVHGVLAKLGIQVTCSDIFGAWGTRWLDELALPQPYCWKVASLRQLIGWLTSEITVLEQVTGDLLAGHDDVHARWAVTASVSVLARRGSWHCRLAILDRGRVPGPFVVRRRCCLRAQGLEGIWITRMDQTLPRDQP